MSINVAHVDFTPESTRKILAEACAAVRLDPTDAALVRLGENAIFSLTTAPVVVRIARGLATSKGVATEMRVARWLAAEQYPAVRLADVADPTEPLMAGGHAVTFWERLPGRGEPTTRRDLARLLRELHALPVPDWLALPTFDPFGRIPDRLGSAPAEVPTEDVEFLMRRMEELRTELGALHFPTPQCAVHGDAHPGNLMRDSDGDVVLIDFEAFCFGPREWDLIPTAAYRHGFDAISAEEYDDFVREYGYDVSQWPGFPVLRAIRELGMTTWLMQMADHDDAARVEYRKRVGDLRSGRFPRHWQRF